MTGRWGVKRYSPPSDPDSLAQIPEHLQTYYNSSDFPELRIFRHQDTFNGDSLTREDFHPYKTSWWIILESLPDRFTVLRENGLVNDYRIVPH